jgi:hypothetical protein
MRIANHGWLAIAGCTPPGRRPLRGAGWHIACESRGMKNTNEEASQRMREVLRNRYPQLSDRDFNYLRGEEEQLVQHLERRTGDTRESIAAILRSVGVNVNVPAASRGNNHDGGELPRSVAADFDHSRGSGIPDDTSRSGGTSM